MKISSPPKNAASLKDFTHFHGMLCRPATAHGCIASFDGQVLFAPAGYTPSTLQQFEYNSGLSVSRLNVHTYYFLVLVSLTGLTTLFSQTECLVAKEEETAIRPTEAFASTFHPELRVEPFVWKYLAPSKEIITLNRHFEYAFGGLFSIKVIMLHVRCNDKLHLVEVYRCENRFFRGLLTSLQRLLSWLDAQRERRKEL